MLFAALIPSALPDAYYPRPRLQQLAAGLTYAAYRQHITAVLAAQGPGPQLAKMLPHYQEGEDRMNALAPTAAVLPSCKRRCNALRSITFG